MKPNMPTRIERLIRTHPWRVLAIVAGLLASIGILLLALSSGPDDPGTAGESNAARPATAESGPGVRGADATADTLSAAEQGVGGPQATGRQAADPLTEPQQDTRRSGNDRSPDDAVPGLHERVPRAYPPDEYADDDGEDLPPERLDISGRVSDDYGEPVPWLEVVAVARDLFDLTEDPGGLPVEREHSAVTEFDGRYVFAGLTDGEYEVHTAGNEFYAPARMVVRAGTGEVNLVVARLRALRIHGIVENLYGEPIARARVRAIGHPVTTDSDEMGEFDTRIMLKSDTLEQVVRFEAAGYRVRDLHLGEADWQGRDQVAVRVQLEPLAGTAEVSGSLTSTTGEAIAGETVQLSLPASTRRYTATSDVDGHFSLGEVVLADDYQIFVRPKGPYGDYSAFSQAVPAGGLELNIQLEPLADGRLAGRMQDADGQPVPGFSLWLRSLSAATWLARITGDGGGNYVAEDVPAGELFFETRAFPLFRVSGIQLEPGASQNVDIVLDWGRHLVQGRVLDSFGYAVPGAEIILSWSREADGLSSRSTRTSVSGADGYFRFTQLGPGPHTLNVRASGYEARRVEYTVGAGDGEIDVVLEDAL